VAEMTEQKPATLAEALAAFQAKLPAIPKAATAKVSGKTKDGRPFEYEYGYADLADVSAVVLPALGAVGLSFSAKPTLNTEGKFVLAYRLLHTSGEHDDGEYPLPSSSPGREIGAQEIGSAITYARRYVLCSMLGVAPDKDDDGAAASHPARQQQRSASKAPRPPTKATRPTPEPMSDGEQPADNGGNDTLMMTDLSRRRMFALFRDLDLDGDANQQMRRTMATRILRRNVDSISELTEVEAHKVITALNERKLTGAST